MIHLTINGKRLASFKKFLPRHKKMFGLRLKEIDVATPTGMVTPVYMPLFYVTTHPGQLILTLNIRNHGYSLLLLERAPFIAFEAEKLDTERYISSDED